MIFILLGPSGCGKGTQADLLNQKYGLPHYSTGDIIRAEAVAGTPEGLEANDYANRGVWAPDELVFRMLKKHLDSPEARGGFILDAYPRTLAQANILEGYLSQKGLRVSRVFLLDTPENVAVERLQGRAVADLETTGKAREDENDEIVAKRLNSFRESIAPIVNYYRGKGVLELVDNSPSIPEVFQAILSRLN